MTELIIRSGKHQGKKLLLPDHDISIGRDEECQIRVASNDVSRKHCILRTTLEGILVVDLGSRNGTLVNDVPVESERLLVAGDTVRIGPMLLEVPGAPSAEPNQDAARPEVPSSDHIATPDEIVGWLTDDDDLDDVGSGTTTIIRGVTPAAEESDSSSDVEPPSDAAVPKSDPSKKKFKSVAEEGSDIIRRWKEFVAEEEE